MKRERKSSFWRSRARLKLKEVIIMRREHRGTQEWSNKDAFKKVAFGYVIAIVGAGQSGKGFAGGPLDIEANQWVAFAPLL